MFRPFFTPVWFNGWDIAFDLVVLLVALLIAGYSWKIFRINKENRYGYFSLAFILISLGLFFKIGTSATLYFTPVRDVAAQVLGPIAGPGLQFSDLLYRGGLFLQMLPTLGAWLLIFFISQRSRARLSKFYEVSQIVLFVYLITLISIVSNFQYAVFYLTSAVLLGLITLNYYKNYLNFRNTNKLRVLMAFGLILLSNLCFALVFASQVFYVAGELILLAGFLVLLDAYRKSRK